QSYATYINTLSQPKQVIASKNKDFPVGTYVVGYPGWRSHTLLTEKELSGANKMRSPYNKLPDFGKIPKSTGLGETVLVNGAAGAVGSAVCQIAKIKGCNVIAFAGSDEKVSWLKNVIGIKNSFNYKTADIRGVIKEAAPNGINCYFDNVSNNILFLYLFRIGYTQNQLTLTYFIKVHVCASISPSHFMVYLISEQCVFETKIEDVVLFIPAM
ncbi:hypothetical protein Avbf_01076, partial [Armadillidium vulgare]